MKKFLLSIIIAFINFNLVLATTAPTNVSPTNGATGQAVQVTLDWSSVTGNNGYIYQIDVVSTFDSPNFIQGSTAVNSSQIDVSNLFFWATYYWRAATKGTADTSAWSATWSFTTAALFTNVSPTNSSVNQPVTVTLDWNGITGNAGYIYQIDTTPNFNSSLFLQGNSAINSSQIDVSNLYFGTTYYWRACAKSTVDTSDWSATWNFTTAALFTLVSPTNGATNQAISLTLDWNPITGNAGYIYQIDTTPNFNSPLFLQGNSAIDNSQSSVSNLYFGTTYYWRACAKSTVDTSDWSATWNFTTAALFTLVSPTNGATNQAISLTLDWNPITGNAGYIYQIDTTPNFDSPLFLQGNSAIDNSQSSVSNLYFGTIYYWRACAKSTVDTSDWSATWNFTTAALFTLVSPTNGATNQAISLTLDWNPITGNAGYIYQIDTTPNFDSPLFLQGNSAIDNSQSSVSNLYFGTTYYWRAAAKSTVDTSDWSATWNFTTAALFTLVSPTNGATNQAISLTLDWNPITGNAGYIYQIDTTPNFDSPLFLQANSAIDYSQADVSNLYFGTTYYWRAAAKSTVDTSDWSATWNFTTASAITNVTPVNNATNVSVNPLLDWNPLTGNTGYLCEFDTSMNFNSSLHQVLASAINTSQTNVSGLMYGTTYYWHAAVINAVDTSDWSATWKFTTAYELTAAPVLVSPANNSIDISYSSVGIEWSASTGAVTYQYQYSIDNTFQTGVHSGTTSLITGTISGLYPHTVYYWRVRGANANGYSPWSTVWQFTTQSAVLTAPALVYPANNATGIDYNSVTIDWDAVYGASQYVYEISTDSTFNTGVTTETLSVTQKTFIGLATNTKYFWRVKASDGVVESNWSEIYNFRTTFAVNVANNEIYGITVYPNPTSDKVLITGMNIYDIEIINCAGQVVLSGKNTENTYDVSDYPDGVYFIKIKTDNTYIVKRLIKN